MKKRRKLRKLRKSTLKRRKIINRTIIIFSSLSFVFLIGFGAVKLFGSIFAVNDIYVCGDSCYDSEEIVEASEIKKGDNMLLLSETASEEKIYEKLANVESAKITKFMPNKISIEIVAAKPVAVFSNEGSYFVVSKNFKLLETKSEPTPELLTVKGAEFEVSKNGKISFKDEWQGRAIETVLGSFEKNSFYGINSIDLSEKNKIKADYSGRITIIFGDEKNFDYKTLTAHELITKKIDQKEKGTLDLSQLGKSNRSYFSSKS